MEKLADAEHASWAGWMEYLFSEGIKACDVDGETVIVIPADSVKHWRRQIKTDYEHLTDEEKESDRKEVYKILPAIAEYVYEWLNTRGFEFMGPEDAAQAFLEEMRGYANERQYR